MNLPVKVHLRFGEGSLTVKVRLGFGKVRLRFGERLVTVR